MRRCRENGIPMFLKLIVRWFISIFYDVPGFTCFLVWKSRREYREMVFGQSWSRYTINIQVYHIKICIIKFSTWWYHLCFTKREDEKVFFLANVWKLNIWYNKSCENKNNSRKVEVNNSLVIVLKISSEYHEWF